MALRLIMPVMEGTLKKPEETLEGQLISLRQACLLTGYTTDHLGWLIRKGRLKGIMVGRDWFTTKESLELYLGQKASDSGLSNHVKRKWRMSMLRNFSEAPAYTVNWRWTLAASLVVILLSSAMILGFMLTDMTPVINLDLPITLATERVLINGFELGEPSMVSSPINPSHNQ